MRKESLISGISESELLQEMETLKVYGGMTNEDGDTYVYCKGAYCGYCPPPSKPADTPPQCQG